MLKDRGVTQEQMLRLKAQYEKMMAEKEGGAGKMTDTKSGGNRLRTINKEMLSSMDSLVCHDGFHSGPCCRSFGGGVR